MMHEIVYDILINFLPYLGSFVLLFWVIPVLIGLLFRLGLIIPHTEPVDNLVIDYFEYFKTVLRIIAVVILIIGLYMSVAGI